MSESARPDSSSNSSPRPLPPSRRRRRWLKRFALAAFGGFVLIALSRLGEREWDRVRGERQLAEALARAEETDPDWTWERLNAARKRPPNGKNAAEVVPQVRAHRHPDWGKQLYSKEWEPRVQQVPPNVRYAPVVVAEVRRDLTASAEAVRLARTLKELPFGHREYTLTPNVLDTLFEETQWTRTSADLLYWDTALAVEDGNSQRAVDNVLSLTGACRSIGDEPSYIAQLIRLGIQNRTVRAAERAVAQSDRPPNLSQLQVALAAEAAEPLLLYGLRGERASAHQFFENLRTGKTTIAAAIREGEFGTWTRIFWDFKYRGERAADHARAIQFFTTYIEVARLPLEKQADTIERLLVARRDPDRIMSSTLLPKPDLFLTYVRGAALLRCAVAGIACERYRHDHGEWPSTLAAIVPAYLASVPLDPLTDKPLRYEESEAGIVIYSPGRNGLDDGGTHDDAEPLLSGRPRFRLWNPAQRRLPAAPETEGKLPP